MIESIIFRDKIINIFDNPILKENKKLYSADSFMLFVGKNGSGKTDLFSSIFNCISNKKEESCEISFGENSTQENNFVIYYTPVPFGEFRPDNSDRAYFYRAQNFIKSSINEEYRVTKDYLIDSFDIRHKSILKIIDFGWQDFDRLMLEIIDSSDEIDCYEIDNIKSRIDLDPNIRFQNGFRYEMRDVVKKVCGENFKLKLQAYKYCIETKKKTSLGFSHLIEGLGFSLKKPPSSEDSNMKRSFRGALNRLIKLNERLGGALYKHSTLELDDIQYHSVKDLVKNLNKIKDGLKKTDGKVELASIYFEKLSSGGAALMDQFTNLQISINKLKTSNGNSKEKNLIILIDEGDAFLHFEWQSKYIKYLDKYVDGIKNDFKTIQVFLSSHSAFLMSEFPREAIFKLDDDELGIFSQDKLPELKEERTFATPLGEIISKIGDSPTIGGFSRDIILELITDIESGKEIDGYRLDMIGDSVIRNQLHKMLGNKND